MDASAAGGGASQPPTRWGTERLAWGAVLMVAILLPVGSTASWFNGTYGATTADLVGGVWILKGALVAIGAAALVLSRIPGASGVAHPPARTEPRWSWLALAAVIALALGLRLYRIDSDLWVDEIMLRARYAPIEVRQLISTYDSQNNQPLYSIMARIAFLAAGGSDWSLRIPSVLFGVASLVALYSFGRQVTSNIEAVLASLILAVSYHHVWFSQNARGYTTMMFLAVLGTGVFLRLCLGTARPARFAWSYALLMALATYTHLSAALVAVGHALALASTTRWNSPASRRESVWPAIALGLSALVTVGLYAPMLPQVLREVSQPTMEGVKVEWTGTGWLVREGVRVLASGVPGGLVTVFGGLSVLAVGVASYWRQSRRVTLLLYLPVVVTLVALVGTRHNLWPRFFFFAAGFLVLTAIRGGVVLVRWLVRVHAERVAVAGACAVALLSLLTVPRAWQPKQQFRAAFDFVESERQPGDDVAALDVAGYMYFLRGWGPWRIANSLSRIEQIERGARRTWIVYTLPARVQALMPDVFEHVSSPRYQSIRVFPATIGGGELYVLRHDSTTGND